MLVSPGEVFDEVLAAPPRLANWLVPTLLVALTSLACFAAASKRRRLRLQRAVRVRSTLGAVPRPNLARRIGNGFRRWPLALGAFAGTLWSGFLLWFIGRVFSEPAFPS